MLFFFVIYRAVGIQCEEVSGYSKGIGHWPGQRLADKPSDHMWNAVWLKGQWGLLDACWGAGTVNRESKTFIKRLESCQSLRVTFKHIQALQTQIISILRSAF